MFNKLPRNSVRQYTSLFLPPLIVLEPATARALPKPQLVPWSERALSYNFCLILVYSLGPSRAHFVHYGAEQ
jgi:hypothetical protein